MGQRGVRVQAAFRACIVGLLAVPALLCTTAGTAGAVTPPSVTIGQLATKVFQNPADSGAFDRTPSSPVEFTQTFPVVNFDSPDTSECSNNVNVDESTRPFTDVVPQSNGTCSTIVMQSSSGEQAGFDNTNGGENAGVDLTSFEAEFETTFTVSAAGDVPFNMFSDDGWIMGIGAGPGGAQPSYVTGALDNAPTNTAFRNFPVVGAANVVEGPSENDVTVHFPAAGTYPVEMDYTECCQGTLAFTVNANSAPIMPTPTAGLTATKTADSATVSPGATDGYTVTLDNTGVEITVTRIVDTLPAGFTYVPGSTTGGITADPTISGQQLTWNGSFPVAATDGSFTFHFGVTATTTPGTYTNSITAGSADAVAASATNVAPITVATIVPVPAFPVEGLPIAAGIVGVAGVIGWRRRRRSKLTA